MTSSLFSVAPGGCRLISRCSNSNSQAVIDVNGVGYDVDTVLLDELTQNAEKKNRIPLELYQKYAVKRGLRARGVAVKDIGVADTPQNYFAIGHLGASGGIQVTASHNTSQYNGFKMSRRDAIPVSYDTGIAELEKLVLDSSVDLDLEPEEPELAEEVPPETVVPEAAPETAVASNNPDPTEQVKSKGILAFRESFAASASLRPSTQLGSDARVRSAGEDAVGRTERNMVTTNAPGSSGGINLASISRDVGGGGGQRPLRFAGTRCPVRPARDPGGGVRAHGRQRAGPLLR